MLKLKILEILTKAYLQISGFIAICFQNKQYIAIIGIISGVCLIAKLIGKAIKENTKPKRY